MSIYSDDFYSLQILGAYNSAKVYCSIFCNILTPSSIIDVGCGRGAWLKAFADSARDSNQNLSTYGVDGPWNSADKLVLDVTEYHSLDLNNLNALKLNKKVDLVISVETAEHLYPNSTKVFIDNLCSMSDAIIFSGALKGQGGLYHFNERFHSDWATFFKKNDYIVYDIFRPKVWGRIDVAYWYQQNIYLYVRNSSVVHKLLSEKGILPVENLSFLDCVHYTAFKDRGSFLGIFKQWAQEKLPPKITIFLSNFKARLTSAKVSDGN
jgi:hypothetical protein